MKVICDDCIFCKRGLLTNPEENKENEENVGYLGYYCWFYPKNPRYLSHIIFLQEKECNDFKSKI
ncbi:MAG: hypothetical protein M0016_00045 [Deltaproteobacteria bacterium]|jgi:hypothetical protein|nr:hypothetical protein [Deltaproteobacteria bacterium]